MPGNFTFIIYAAQNIRRMNEAEPPVIWINENLQAYQNTIKVISLLSAILTLRITGKFRLDSNKKKLYELEASS